MDFKGFGVGVRFIGVRGTGDGLRFRVLSLGLRVYGIVCMKRVIQKCIVWGRYSVRCPVSARPVKQGIHVDLLRVLSNM